MGGGDLVGGKYLMRDAIELSGLHPPHQESKSANKKRKIQADNVERQ